MQGFDLAAIRVQAAEIGTRVLAYEQLDVVR